MSFKVNIDEMIGIFKSADYFLYKAQDICIKADKSKVYLNVNFLDSDLRFEYPIVESDGLEPTVVSSKDLMKTLKIMSGMTTFSLQKNGLTIVSTGNKYKLQTVDTDFKFFFDFDPITETVQVDNGSFRHLQKHCNNDAGNDSDSICQLDGHWYATDVFNTVRVPSGGLDHVLMNGSYTKFISTVKENFKMGVSDDAVLFKNSNFDLRLSNGDFADSMFQDHQQYFGKEFKFICSFDSKSLSTRYVNIKTVMSQEDMAQSGMKIGIHENGYIKVDAGNKYGSETVLFNNISEELDLIVDSDSLDKVLYSCDNDIVDLYAIDVGNSERLFKAVCGDVEQIFKGVCV